MCEKDYISQTDGQNSLIGIILFSPWKDLIFPENLLNFLQHLRLFFEKTQVFLKAQI